jgi:hypothetical protein
MGVLDDGDASSGRVDRVPAGMSFVLEVDADGLLADQRLRSRIDEMLDVIPRTPDSFSTVLDEVETETGLDPRGIGDVVTFGSLEDESFGSIAWTEYTIEELTSLAEDEGATPEQTTYGGKQIYRSQSSGTVGSLGVLEEGTFAVGTEGIVEDVIDVWNDDADAVGGEVRTAFESAKQGYVRVGFDVPSEAVPSESGGQFDLQTFQDVQFGYGSYSIVETDGSARLSFRAGSTGAAEDLKAMIDAALVMGEQELSGSERTPRSEAERAMLEDVKTALEETSVSRDGATVTITNSRGTITVGVLLPAVVASFVLGLGQQSRPVAPQIMFSYEYDSDANTLRITHDGGDTVKRSELYLRGRGFSAVSGVDQTGNGVWQGSASGTNGGEPAVVAGDSVTVGVDADYDMRVIFQSQDGDTSATLAADTGPEE